MKNQIKKTGWHYTDIAIDYANAILNGEILSCRAVKSACKRFSDDLKSIKNESYLFDFDFEAVEEVCSFVESLTLPDTKKPIQLLGWQVFVYANFYGFVYKDNHKRKRFRTGFVFVARKNGKTAGLLYGMNLYNLLTDSAAESYLISATDDQSNKSFNEISQIIKSNKELDEACSCYSSAITFDSSSRLSFFSSQTSALDGYRPSFATLDEYWNFASNKPLTAMRYGTRARLSGQILIITTAGIGIDSPCYIEYTKAKKILEGNLMDDSYFALIYEYDEEDDWKDSSKFIKANPSLGTILQKDVLISDLNSAIATPSEKPDFVAKTCNRFIADNVAGWIPLDKWKQQKEQIDYEKFKEIPAFGGLDLSSVSDLTVFTLCWKKDDRYYFKHRFFIPEETVLLKYKTDTPMFIHWVDSGIVTTTPGATNDYNIIMNYILEDCKNFNVQEIAFDRWQASMLIQKLDEMLPHITFLDYDQSLKNFGNPTKEYERLVLSEKIIDPNPVQKWCLSNVCIKPVNDNYKPMKKYKSSTSRIDSVVTSIMAMDRCQTYNNELENARNGQIDLRELLECF